MQSIKSSVLRHLGVQASFMNSPFPQNTNVFAKYSRLLCTSVGKCPLHIMDRVIGLVQKFDKSDASKVTETADFQKDLCLDSLDRVELVMAFGKNFPSTFLTRKLITLPAVPMLPSIY